MTVVSRRIPATNLEVLRGKVDTLNRRAARLKVAPLTLKVVSTETTPVKDDDTGLEYEDRFHVVEIHGESPVLAGWALVAAVSPEPTSGKENIVRTVPGEVCPVEFRNVSLTRCDHCHTARSRKDVFVLRHDNGEYKVVGRNCLGDFLGHASPEALLNAAEFLFDADETLGGCESDLWGAGGGAYLYELPLERFVGMTYLWIRRFGWVPRRHADVSTADRVWNFLLPARSESEAYERKALIRKNNLVVEEGDLDWIRGAIEWGRALPTNKSDYIYNLGVACRAGLVTSRTSGIVASLVNAYKRHLGEEAKRKAAPTRKHVGTPKKREGFAGVAVTGSRSFETVYGTTTLVTFETGDGNILKWFASGDAEKTFKVGNTYDITATVKSHGDYKGTPETLVSRVVEGLPKTAAEKRAEAKAKREAAKAANVAG